MRKIVFILCALFVLVGVALTQTKYEQRIYPKTASENVWDTILLNTSTISKQVEVEILSGNAIVSFSQGTESGRDTTRSYDSIPSGQYRKYYTEQRKMYIKGIGGTTIYKGIVRFGVQLNDGRGSSSSATSATTNLYGYAYKDSANVFTAKVTLTDTVVTTVGGICTTATQTGVITTDNLTGLSNITVTMYNDLITTNSVILITLETPDFATNQISAGITAIHTGNLDITILISGGVFGSDLKIHYLIN